MANKYTNNEILQELRDCQQSDEIMTTSTEVVPADDTVHPCPSASGV